MDVIRYKERYDKMKKQHRGRIRVSGRTYADVMAAFEAAIGPETQERVGKMEGGRNSELTFDQFLHILVPHATTTQIQLMTSWLPQATPTAFKPKLKKKLMSEYELTNYRRLFQRNDSDQDGRLDLWELQEVLRKLHLDTRLEGNQRYSNGLNFREFLELVRPAHVEIPADVEG